MKKPAKHLRRTIWINEGFLNVRIGFCPSKHAWNKSMASLNIKGNDWQPEGRSAAVHTFENGTNADFVMIVALYQDFDATDTILTLVHEAVHVWQFSVKNMREKDAGIEMEAYGIEHIVRELFCAYAKTLGKDKKTETLNGSK